MLLTITKIELSDTEFTANGIQLAYAIKPTAQSWDFIEAGAKKNTNIGVDALKFSIVKDSVAALSGKKIGDELALAVSNAADKISGTFVITDIAVRNGYTVYNTMLKAGTDITESAI